MTRWELHTLITCVAKTHLGTSLLWCLKTMRYSESWLVRWKTLLINILSSLTFPLLISFLTPLGLITGLPLGVLRGEATGLGSGLVTFGLPAGLAEACRNLARLKTGGRLSWGCSWLSSSLFKTTFGGLVILCTSSSSLELRLSSGEQAVGKDGGERVKTCEFLSLCLQCVTSHMSREGGK